MKPKLKNILSDSELMQLGGMSNYWNEVDRRDGDASQIKSAEVRQLGVILGVKLLSILSDYVALREYVESLPDCGCSACAPVAHASDCGVHNLPAIKLTRCNCK